jgi:metal-dependent hydrolase (beta-lactamase superfamily II)
MKVTILMDNTALFDRRFVAEHGEEISHKSRLHS